MLADDAADRFARYCDVVMERFGDRIAFALTLNEPNLPRLLAWVLPDFVVDLTRATLKAASEAAGVERYRASNVVQPEDYDAIEDGLSACTSPARPRSRPAGRSCPSAFSIAMVDDVAAPGGEALRDRKRDEVYGRWLDLARDDDFVGVQNYERVVYGPDGPVPAPEARC